MTYVIGILILVVLASAFAYAKVPAFKAFIDSKLKKPAAPVATNAPVPAPAPNAAPAIPTIAPAGTVASTAAYYPTPEAAAFRDAQVANAANQPPVDRSGFDLAWTSGNPKINDLSDNEFTFTVPDGYKGIAEITLSRVANSPNVESAVIEIDGARKYEGPMADLAKAIEVGVTPGVHKVRVKIHPAGRMALQLNHE